MQKIAYLTMGVLLSFLMAYEKDTSEKTLFLSKNTVNISTPQETQEKHLQKNHHNNPLKNPSQTTSPNKLPKAKQNTSSDLSHTKEISFQDLQGRHHTLHIDAKKIYLDNQPTKNLIITLFSTWCLPCKGQLPYLNDIYKKHTKNLTMLGFIVNDDIQKEKLKTFLSDYKIHFPVSRNKEAVKNIIQALGASKNYPLPLTALYYNGNYIIHYEGAVPPEIIEHDIATSKEH